MAAGRLLPCLLTFTCRCLSEGWPSSELRQEVLFFSVSYALTDIFPFGSTMLFVVRTFLSRNACTAGAIERFTAS